MRVAETFTILFSLTAAVSRPPGQPSSTFKPRINEITAKTAHQLVVPNVAAEAGVNKKVAVSFSAGPPGPLQLTPSLTQRQSYPPLPWDGSKPGSWKRDPSPDSGPDPGDDDMPAEREIESRSDDAKPCVPTGLHGGHIGPDCETDEIRAAPSTPTPSHAQSLDRPLSKPPTDIESAVTPDSNLFYAYGRQSDNVDSRYLLTFASAAIANQWWLLLQVHFPDCTRPGAQLFSFNDADLLSNAWRHPSFAHLKSKWMYIAFGDTQEHAVGGAAQGIIPVQDAQGNMLGGSASASPELGQVRREAKMVRNEMSKVEEFFERMMEAVERNTQQVAQLAAERQQGGSPQVSQLTAHLDRLQLVREQAMKHKDGTEVPVDTEKGINIDFSPLTDRLEKVQEAVEQNSALLKALLERECGLEGAQQKHNSLSETADEQPHLAGLASKLDGVNQHLESLREWAEFDSEQLKELIDGQKEMRGASKAHDTTDFDPLAEKLGQIMESQNAARRQQDGFKAAPADIDFTPVTERLARIHDALERQAESPHRPPGSGDPKFVMSALTSHLSKIQAVTESNATQVRSLQTKHSSSQDKMHLAVAQTADQLRTLSVRQVQSDDKFDRRLEAVHGQVRELMTGQREMVAAMRELSQAITAHNKESCEHVVIPPPRKTGKKVVGFVYDAKEGSADGRRG
ncbi:hypothetical protein Tdes44962_MAKER01733 [Teratosphaeria destructans]|uniref:Uncharacterized protein n=1 Tax=Teratosphaeria destructans TaxID=418781 RepID=A0A9W7SXI3_9PEZI|nr:hypothetical protein Tdes44962_MAKER01733 [Teratosphaeria destructans]